MGSIGGLVDWFDRPISWLMDSIGGSIQGDRFDLYKFEGTTSVANNLFSMDGMGGDRLSDENSGRIGRCFSLMSYLVD